MWPRRQHTHTRKLCSWDIVRKLVHRHCSALCIFMRFLCCTGYLSPGNESEHIQPGTRLELPLWMARSLCGRRRNIATVDVPRPYRLSHRKILDADATAVDLHRLCPYYYSVGTHLLAFELTESADIARSMLLVYTTPLPFTILDFLCRRCTLRNIEFKVERMLKHFGHLKRCNNLETMETTPSIYVIIVWFWRFAGNLTTLVQLANCSMFVPRRRETLGRRQSIDILSCQNSWPESWQA